MAGVHSKWTLRQMERNGTRWPAAYREGSGPYKPADLLPPLKPSDGGTPPAPRPGRYGMSGQPAGPPVNPFSRFSTWTNMAMGLRGGLPGLAFQMLDLAMQVDAYNRERINPGAYYPLGSTSFPNGWTFVEVCGPGGGPRFAARINQGSCGVLTVQQSATVPYGVQALTHFPDFAHDHYSYTDLISSANLLGHNIAGDLWNGAKGVYAVQIVPTGSPAPSTFPSFGPRWWPNPDVAPGPTPVQTTHGDPDPKPQPDPTTTTYTPGGGPPTTTTGTYDRDPPGPNVKERKLRLSKTLGFIIGALNTATEWLDVVEALYDSINPDCKAAAERQMKGSRRWDNNHVVKKGRNAGRLGGYVWDRPSNKEVPIIKANAVYHCLSQIDIDSAVFNLVWQQMIEDWVYAKVGLPTKELQRAYGQNLGINRSDGTHMQAKEVGDLLHAAEAAVKQKIMDATGLTILPAH